MKYFLLLGILSPFGKFESDIREIIFYFVMLSLQTYIL